MNIPIGNVTFLYTDIEGSTMLAQQFPEHLHDAIQKHHIMLESILKSNNGYVIQVRGDAFCSAFSHSQNAIKAACEIQKQILKENWGKTPIKVRIGLNIGNVKWNGKEYSPYMVLARTARIMSIAHGDQILISHDLYCSLRNENINEFTFRDLGERRLKSIIKPEHLYQILADGLLSDFPPLNTLDARPNNLPVQLTSFIGRDEEIKEVKELLRSTHLLTLTGTGGAGKTRLALQIGADVIDDFANGVWFVELASILDPLLLPQAILNALRIKEEPKKTLEEILTGYLKDKEILIILDNCEHLIEACALLTEKLLTTSPKLKIIATSREGLKCAGEQTHRILSLETPNLKGEISIEQLTQYESVRLFIERALALNPKFKVNNKNAPALAGICTQLDGIPLAIELAAAHIKVLTVERIYERLNDRFSLLTGGKRTALPRQQTLKALIDWSYDLLSEQEKVLWGRLSVFIDGWTLEAAEKICSGNKVKKEEILDLLSLLVEKSIIIFNEEQERFRILESLKQYGEEKLRELNEIDEILSKHLYYYTKFSELAEPKLKGNEAMIWLEKLEIEHCNLQFAIEYSLSGSDREKGARLGVALVKFWDIRGYYSTGRRLLESILIDKIGISMSMIGKAMNGAGTLATNQGDYVQAQQFHKDGYAMYCKLGDKHGIANSLNNLGILSYIQGNYEPARKFFDDSLEIKIRIGDKDGVAGSLNNLGLVMYCQKDYKQAQKFFKESLTFKQEIGDKDGVAASLNNLGLVTYSQKDYVQAQKFFQDSLALRQEMGDKRGISYSLNNLGKVSYSLGVYYQAQKFYEQSLVLSRELGNKRGIADSLSNLSSVRIEQGDYEHAWKFYQESLTLWRELGNKLGVLYSIVGLAEIAGVKNNHKNAVYLLGFVESAPKSILSVFESDELKRYQHTIKMLHEKLSDKEFNEYWEEGKNLSLDEAVELALKKEENE